MVIFQFAMLNYQRDPEGNQPHRIHGAAIYGTIYHQYTPVMLALIYHTWILWELYKNHNPVSITVSSARQQLSLRASPESSARSRSASCAASGQACQVVAEDFDGIFMGKLHHGYLEATQMLTECLPSA